jgi:hypothetical protein
MLINVPKHIEMGRNSWGINFVRKNCVQQKKLRTTGKTAYNRKNCVQQEKLRTTEKTAYNRKNCVQQEKLRTTGG